MYKLTKEQERISNANKQKAINFFIETGQWEDGMVLHHLDTTLRHENVEEYIKWENVVPMKKADHNRLHHTGSHHTQETKAKMSAAKLGKKRSEEAKRSLSEGHKGCKLSEQTKRNLSIAMKKAWAKRKQKENSEVPNVAPNFK